ncbi:hypothetical protein FRC10_001145 [Ceratobasidium sp. 414]|nr:hypothetical protein FRC10_001145 [Ceratobasidium sp. 414]
MATEAPLIMSYHRPNSLLIPPSPAYAPISPRGGILIRSPMTSSSSASGLWPGTYTPRSPSPLSASLSPDSAPADRSSSLGSRKIRFAPLPEPRRDVMVDEAGAEIPCSSSYPADATSFPVQLPGAGTSVTLDRTDSLMTDSGASTASTEADTQSQVARKKEKRNSLFRIFGMKNSSPKRTSVSSLPTADANGTIGGIPVPGLGLFRPSSRESWSGELSGYTSDNSVSRRMSSPLRPESSNRSRPTTPNYGSFGAPMMQATSDGSGSVQRPQRMLNGRVYGARRAKERLQPQPSMEPEFSEWGYGGMGSVGSSGEYGKLQSNSSAVGGDDDGSGMTWARKRKEKREREEREKKAAEEAAAAEAAKKAAEESTESNAEPRTSTETSNSTPTIHAEPAETATEPKTPTRETHNPILASPAASQPPLRANSTPLSHPRTQATRSIANPPSRQDSGATVTPERHFPTVITVPAHRGRQDNTVLGHSVAMSPETSPERSSGSSHRSSSDEEDAEDSSSTTGRDEDEDEEEENQKRKTALSAGIEKISRHHA